jgi:hypothetical protein
MCATCGCNYKNYKHRNGEMIADPTGKQPFTHEGYKVPPMPKGNKRAK